MRITAIFTTVFMFTLAATGGPVFADAWSDYQAVKTQQRAQNRQLMKDFKDGKITAEQLQDKWGEMRDEASVAAKKCVDEWEGKKPDTKPKGEAKKDAEKKPEAEKTEKTGDGKPPAVSPPGGTVKGPGVGQEGDDFHFQPSGVSDDTGGSFTEASGLELETQPIEYRDGAQKDMGGIKMSGIPKYANITLKRGILDNDEIWALPSWSQIRSEAIPLEDQHVDEVPGDRQIRTEDEKTAKAQLDKTEAALQGKQLEYETKGVALGEARKALREQAGTLAPSAFLVLFSALLLQWLTIQLVIIMAVFLHRISWLFLFILFQLVLGMVGGSKFGLDPFSTGIFFGVLGRDIITAAAASQRECVK